MLWVSGLGGDSAPIKLDSFATLYMDKLTALKNLLSRRRVRRRDGRATCRTALQPQLRAAASIDTPCTPMPKPFVDHMNPDDHRHRRRQEFQR